MTLTPDRRSLVAGAAAGVLSASPLVALAAQAAARGPIQTRPIPHGGERIPVVGIGTSIVFEWENDPAKYAERKQVIEILTTGGRCIIDTAASYGTAEARVGDLLSDMKARDKVFLATKCAARETPEQREASFKRSQERLKTQKFDLMQAHNVSDPNQDFGQFRDWKAKGLIRYWGITSSFDAAYPALAQVLKREKPDFFQINYSLGDRDAEAVLLPTAQDAGCAVLTNLPFGRNSLFAKVNGKPLPDWAKEIDATSWAQVFLKFLLSHPAVTAVIPGTDKPQYMIDNLAAGRGRMPDAAMRKRIVDYWGSLA